MIPFIEHFKRNEMVVLISKITLKMNGLMDYVACFISIKKHRFHVDTHSMGGKLYTRTRPVCEMLWQGDITSIHTVSQYIS